MDSSVARNGLNYGSMDADQQADFEQALRMDPRKRAEAIRSEKNATKRQVLMLAAAVGGVATGGPALGDNPFEREVNPGDQNVEQLTAEELEKIRGNLPQVELADGDGGDDDWNGEYLIADRGQQTLAVKRSSEAAPTSSSLHNHMTALNGSGKYWEVYGIICDIEAGNLDRKKEGPKLRAQLAEAIGTEDQGDLVAVYRELERRAKSDRAKREGRAPKKDPTVRTVSTRVPAAAVESQEEELHQVKPDDQFRGLVTSIEGQIVSDPTTGKRRRDALIEALARNISGGEDPTNTDREQAKAAYVEARQRPDLTHTVQRANTQIIFAQCEPDSALQFRLAHGRSDFNAMKRMISKMKNPQARTELGKLLDQHIQTSEFLNFVAKRQ